MSLLEVPVAQRGSRNQRRGSAVISERGDIRSGAWAASGPPWEDKAWQDRDAFNQEPQVRS